MNGFEEFKEILPFLIPLAVLQLGLMAFALWDLAHREVVKGGRKWPWALVIIFVNLFGPILYLLVGREQY